MEEKELPARWSH